MSKYIEELSDLYHIYHKNSHTAHLRSLEIASKPIYTQQCSERVKITERERERERDMQVMKTYDENVDVTCITFRGELLHLCQIGEKEQTHASF